MPGIYIFENLFSCIFEIKYDFERNQKKLKNNKTDKNINRESTKLRFLKIRKLKITEKII